VNPQTREAIRIPAKKVPKFRPGKKQFCIVFDLFSFPGVFLRGCCCYSNRVKDAVLELIFDKRVKEKKGQIFLSERQRKVSKYLQTNLKITTKEYQDMFNVSERTARGHLNELVHNSYPLTREYVSTDESIKKF